MYWWPGWPDSMNYSCKLDLMKSTSFLEKTSIRTPGSSPMTHPSFCPHTSKALSRLNCPIHPYSITVKSFIRAHAISSAGLSVVGLGWKLVRVSLILGTEKSVWKRRTMSRVEWAELDPKSLHHIISGMHQQSTNNLALELDIIIW